MAIVATDSSRFSNVIKHEYEPSIGYTREVVTLRLSAGATLQPGTVLAKVTASGKFLVQDASLAAGAGLEASAILIGLDERALPVVAAANTDYKVLVLKRGPATVAKSQLVFGAGTDTDPEKQAVYDALAALGIIAVDQV